ncbi:hypothetical protein [Pseudaquabacterium pictum]|uniref:Uncharacterized protein n=1 Tax=Pseudaquabacterium pictum TaxID=2315236 RepID=A0A480ALH2_9BURK|nr:hypothetical protein [Rubrivivax pictus]GCL62243.1 hypothetical protein AQPW35_13240 [Rubrivivax pictus]
MPPIDPDDDPTHALDDFVRRMRQPAGAPPAPPDLADLDLRLQPDTPAAARRGGVLRSGQRWTADDVEDVPVVDLPRPPPPATDIPQVTLPPVDLQAEQLLAALQPEVDLPAVDAPPPPDADSLADTTRSARDFAASQWDLDDQAASEPVWQPDPAALQLRTASHPRLLPQWQPTAWVGAVRLVFDSATEFVQTASGPAVETYTAHRLLLLWPPQAGAGLPGRWPQQAQLLAVPAREVGVAALALLPADATLWLMPASEGVDWALGAELVLHHLPTLRPYQLQRLRDFIAAEREADFARLNDRYHQPVPGAAVMPRPVAGTR